MQTVYADKNVKNKPKKPFTYQIKISLIKNAILSLKYIASLLRSLFHYLYTY